MHNYAFFVDVGLFGNPAPPGLNDGSLNAEHAEVADKARMDPFGVTAPIGGPGFLFTAARDASGASRSLPWK